jgi:hypothetical protein
MSMLFGLRLQQTGKTNIQDGNLEPLYSKPELLMSRSIQIAIFFKSYEKLPTIPFIAC